MKQKERDEVPAPCDPPKRTRNRIWGPAVWLFWMVLGFGFVTCLMFFETEYIPRCCPPSSATNISNILKACFLYTERGARPFPPDLPVLYAEGYVSHPSMFVCPNSLTKPSASTDPRDIVQHCDYVYIAGMDSGTPSNRVWVYELGFNHFQEGANLGYCDGSVYRRTASELTEAVQKSNDYLAERRRGQP